MQTKHWYWVLGVLLGMAPLFADAGSVPPEVSKTTDAFSGHWTLVGTDTEPGAAAPAAVHATMDCKAVALGAAVSCLIAAEISGIRIGAATVIGYSPDEHLVRWMEISSTGEYHDHRGPWNGDRITFEPLTYTVAGATMTEYFSVSFLTAGEMTWSAITKTRDGESRLDLTGIRKSH